MHRCINVTTVFDGKINTGIPREPLFNAEETSKLMGYNTVKGLWSAVDRGVFPNPDTITRKMSGGNNKKCFWKKSVVLAEIKKKQLTLNQN